MINIAKLLKDAPKGMKLYSPLFGEVELHSVRQNYRNDDDTTISVNSSDPVHKVKCFDPYGRYFALDGAECLLFPSKEHRTWEDFVLPKFKVGDELQSGMCWVKVVGLDYENRKYICDGEHLNIYFKNQDLWKLKLRKPHYDISNFNPFDKVLVRQNDSSTWGVSFFGRFDGMFMCCTNVWFEQCIPFNEDTKHLLGTTDMCDEQYINW